ncbi:MAG: hypothetical protein IJT16_10790 [Lachnospiraceae bacterium]|nr:hypothetical protein [Lachnospiraceae bacterium]
MGKNGAGVRVKRTEILNRKSNEFSELGQFSTPVTLDMKKVALARAKAYLQNARNSAAIEDDEESIESIYSQVVLAAKAIADDGLKDGDGVELAFDDSNSISIMDKMLDKIISSITDNMTKTSFCKQLAVFGKLVGHEFFQRNRKEGYSSATTRVVDGKKFQRRYYRLNIISDFL